MNTQHVLLIVARRYSVFGAVLRDTTHFLRKSIKRNYNVYVKKEILQQKANRPSDWITVVYTIIINLGSYPNDANVYEIQVSPKHIWISNREAYRLTLKIDRKTGVWLRAVDQLGQMSGEDALERGTIYNFESNRAIEYIAWCEHRRYSFDPKKLKKKMKQAVKDVEMIQSLEMFK